MLTAGLGDEVPLTDLRLPGTRTEDLVQICLDAGQNRWFK